MRQSSLNNNSPTLAAKGWLRQQPIICLGLLKDVEQFLKSKYLKLNLKNQSYFKIILMSRNILTFVGF